MNKTEKLSDDVLSFEDAVQLAIQMRNNVLDGYSIHPISIERLCCAVIKHVELLAAPKPVTQFRKCGCSDWYDGLPDCEDGCGPYETRTLYAEASIQCAQPAWQPIETAPKVGAHLAWEDGKRPYVIVWLDADHPDSDGAGWYEHWSFNPVEPTHWMPLPATPEEVAQPASEQKPINWTRLAKWWKSGNEEWETLQGVVEDTFAETTTPHNTSM